MIYLSGSIDLPLLALKRPDVGVMLNPNMGQQPPSGVLWAADNGCFGRDDWEPQPWLDWLESLRKFAPTCLFAVCPDVVADARRTYERRQFLTEIRELGYKAAYVLQDGIEGWLMPDPINWDCLFIGGSTEFKISETAYGIATSARRLGKHIHMGRVNSSGRIFAAAQQRFNSVDGTFLRFGPDANRHRLLDWLNLASALEHTPGLFEDDGAGNELASVVGL